jgi:DNA-directed RNA polymerase specialized sigma24 family protein
MTGRKKPSGNSPQAQDDSKSFLAWLEAVPDPRERYRRATEELDKHQKAVERLSAVRATAASDAYESGETIRALAEQLGVSPARVHQLIQEAKARSAKETGPKRRPTGRQKGGS